MNQDPFAELKQRQREMWPSFARYADNVVHRTT